MGSKLKISIIIPVHNQFNLLDNCLKSIYECIDKKKIKYEIILSDSNSNSYLSEYYNLIDFNTFFGINQVKIIRDEDKPGFSRAVNNGMKIASKLSDYYIWLNSDTLLTKNCFDSLINKEYDLCSPISNSASYQTMIMTEKQWIPEIGQFIQENKIFLKQFNLRVDFINGFCYIINNKVFKTIGFLDEIRFPHYASEDDYSLRSKIKGFQATILCDSFVFHHGNQSYQKNKNSKLRQVDKIFLSKYPEEWFKQLIKAHTIKTRNLRQQLIERYLEWQRRKLER